MAEIRRMLVLSTAHVPDSDLNRDVFNEGEMENCIVHRFDEGFWLWVPSDPSEEPENTPEWVLKVQRYARECRCDWIQFDADGPIEDDLEVFDDER